MDALWLVDLANHIFLHGPLIKKYMNNFFFLIRAEIYKTEFFSTRISGPRASPLGLKSEPKKKSFCNLQDGPRTRLAKGTYTA